MLDRPNWSFVDDMLSEVKRAMSGLGEVQSRMSRITGEAWSPDRMIRVLVGPRGQLIELEINPRALRKPDSLALAAAILATVRKAVEETTRKSAALIDETLPADMRGQSAGLSSLLQTHDSVLVEGGEAHG